MAARFTIQLGLDSQGVEAGGARAKDSLDKYSVGARTAEHASKLLAETMKYLTGAIAGLVAFEGIKDLIRDVFEASIEGESALAKLGATVTATGGRAGLTVSELEALAKSIQDTTVYSHGAIEGAEAALLKFGNVQGETFKRALRASVDLAAQSGADVTSMAQAVGRALEIPGQAKKLLAAAGVVLSKEQEEEIKSMLALNNVAGAQSAILGMLEGTSKGVAEKMANTLGGAWEQLKNTGHDLLEAVGEGGLTSAFKDLAQAVNANAKDNTIIDFMKHLGLGVHLVVLELMVMGDVLKIAPNITKLAVGQMLEIFGNLLKFGPGRLIPALAQMGTTMAQVGKQMSQQAFGGLGDAISGVVGRTAQLRLAWDDFGKVEDEQKGKAAGLRTDLGETDEQLAKQREKIERLIDALKARADAEELATAALKAGGESNKEASIQVQRQIEMERALHEFKGKDLEIAQALIAKIYDNKAAQEALNEAKKIELEGAKQIAEENGVLLNLQDQLSIAQAKAIDDSDVSATTQAALNELVKKGGILNIAMRDSILAVGAALDKQNASNAAAAGDQAIALENTKELAKAQAAINEEMARNDATAKYGAAIAAILEKHHLLTKAYADEVVQQRVLAQVQREQQATGAKVSAEREAQIRAEIQAGEDLVMEQEQQIANLEILQAKHDAIAEGVSSMFDLASQAMGGTSTAIGRLLGDFSKLTTQIYDAAKGWAKMNTEAKLMAAAGIIGAIGAALKDMNVGASNKTGGTSSFGGKLEGNYAGVGSMIGTVIGAAIAAYFTAGAATGAGAAIGGAIGGVVGSLISKGADEASAHLSANGSIAQGIERANSPKLAGAVLDILNSTFKGVSAELASFGMGTAGMPTIDVKIRDNIVRVFVGSVMRTFSSMQEAISFAITEATRQVTEGHGPGFLLPPEVLAAIKNSTATDLQGLQSDIDFAKAIANYGVPKVVQAIDKSISDYFVAMQRASELGIDTTKVTQQFIDQLKAQKDSILGIDRTKSPQDQMRADAAAFNQHVALIKAEEQASIADMQVKRADLVAKLAILRAEAGVAKASGEIAKAKLGADVAAQQAQFELIKTEVDAIKALDVAMQAAQTVIDSLVTISDQELNDALSRIGKGSGGGSNPVGDFIAGKKYDIGEMGKGPAQKAIDDLMKQYADEAKQLPKNSKELAELLKLRDQEIKLTRKQTHDQFEADSKAYLSGGDPYGIQAAQDAQKKMVDEANDAFKSGAIGAGELARKLAMFEKQAQSVQFQSLQQGAYGILQGLYDYLGMTKESEELKHTIAVAQLLAAQASLKAALASADLTEEQRKSIQKLVDGMGPLIDKVVNDPNYGNGNGTGGGVTQGGQGFNTTGYSGNQSPGSSGGSSSFDSMMAKLQQYEDQGVPQLVLDLRAVNKDFADMRSVLGDSVRLQNAYNAAMQRVMDQALQPYKDMLQSLTQSDLSPLTQLQKIQDAQAQFNAASAAIRAGDLSHFDQLPGLLQNLLQQAQSGLPIGSEAYRKIFQAGNQVLRDIMAQYGSAANIPGAGGTAGGTGVPGGGSPGGTAGAGSGQVVDAVQFTGMQTVQVLTRAANRLDVIHDDLQDINSQFERGIFIRQTA